MNSNDICNVTNRSSGYVGYTLPERHITRQFRPGETKRLPFYEIEEVTATPGGRNLVYNYLFVEDKILKDGLDMKPEPEYYLTEDNIDNWMNTCSLDQFKDALDFAPAGVKDLIKSHAVKLPLNDMAKCEAIHKQLGFDILRAIKNERDTVEDEVLGNQETHQRRAEPAEIAGSEPTRRVASKYNVVKREGE